MLNYLKEETFIQTIIFFIGEHNYERPHTNDNILDIDERRPTNQIVTKCSSWNIVTTLRGTNILKVEKGHNDADDNNDTNILDEAIETPNDSDYHEPWPQHPNSTISHLPRSQVTRASQS